MKWEINKDETRLTNRDIDTALRVEGAYNSSLVWSCEGGGLWHWADDSAMLQWHQNKKKPHTAGVYVDSVPKHLCSDQSLLFTALWWQKRQETFCHPIYRSCVWDETVCFTTTLHLYGGEGQRCGNTPIALWLKLPLVLTTTPSWETRKLF